MSGVSASAEGGHRGNGMTRKRSVPKTAEQLLADAEKRLGVLRAKVIANRDRQRAALIEDLFRKYDVGPIIDDASEGKRLAALRSKLGL